MERNPHSDLTLFIWEETGAIERGSDRINGGTEVRVLGSQSPQLISPAAIQANPNQGSCLAFMDLHSLTPQYHLLPPSLMMQGAFALITLLTLIAPRMHTLFIHWFAHHSFLIHRLSSLVARLWTGFCNIWSSPVLLRIFSSNPVVLMLVLL